MGHFGEPWGQAGWKQRGTGWAQWGSGGWVGGQWEVWGGEGGAASPREPRDGGGGRGGAQLGMGGVHPTGARCVGRDEGLLPPALGGP